MAEFSLPDINREQNPYRGKEIVYTMSDQQAAEAEFALFAPYNEHVALVGDWNGWEPIPMTRGDDGWWRVSVPLADGDYQYKFQVKSKSYFAEGELVTIADPRSLVVSDDYENTCITVKNGRRVLAEHQWQHDDHPLPSNPELVIYELHVQDFSGGPGDDQAGPKGRFQDTIDKLDYLVELGINAIELMPVSEFPGEHGWGYNPRYLFAVEKSYGTPDDLCRLVDECHARGIRVILDGVYNHTEVSTPLAHIDHNYWYYGESPDAPEHQWGPKFNYEFYDPELDCWPARQFVLDAILHWIAHFHIDGIRFDATAIIKNYDVLNWLQAAIYQHLNGSKPFITIAEHVPQDPSVTGLEGPLDAAWHENFSKQIMCTIVGREQDGRQPYNLDALVSVIDPRRDGFASAQNVVNYIDNHDQDRIMWQLGQAGIIDDPAFRRVKMGAAILLTAPGMPMLWMGQEFGESAPRTQERQPIDWALLQNERNADLQRAYRGLIYLRKTTPALQADTFDVVHLDQERCIMAYKRWNDEGNIVVVVANLLDQFAGEVEIPNWPGDGTWHEYTHDYDVEVGGGVLRDSLAESEVKVYIKAG